MRILSRGAAALSMVAFGSVASVLTLKISSTRRNRAGSRHPSSRTKGVIL